MFKLKNKVLKLKKHSRSIKKQTEDQSKKNNNLKVIGSVNLSYKSLSLLKNNWRIFMPIIILFFVAFFITLVHDITFKTDLPVILSNITSIGALIYFYFYYYRKNSP
jgi:hypothetical protein